MENTQLCVRHVETLKSALLTLTLQDHSTFDAFLNLAPFTRIIKGKMTRDKFLGKPPTAIVWCLCGGLLHYNL